MRKEITMYNLDEIKSALKGSDIIDLLGVEQKTSGKVTFIRCPEPEHKDNNIGSCRVTDSGYVCYACGRYGSVIDLYGKIKGLSFSRAVGDLGKLLDLNESQNATQCPLSSEDKAVLGLSNSHINKLWATNQKAYHYVISNLIVERGNALAELKPKLSRTNENFIKIKNEEILYKLRNLSDEWDLHLRGMVYDK